MASPGGQGGGDSSAKEVRLSIGGLIMVIGFCATTRYRKTRWPAPLGTLFERCRDCRGQQVSRCCDTREPRGFNSGRLFARNPIPGEHQAALVGHDTALIFDRSGAVMRPSVSPSMSRRMEQLGKCMPVSEL